MCGGPGPNVHFETGFPAVSVSLILPSLGGLQMAVSVGLSHRHPTVGSVRACVCDTRLPFWETSLGKDGGHPLLHSPPPSGSGILESPFFLVPPASAGGRAAGHGG